MMAAQAMADESGAEARMGASERRCIVSRAPLPKAEMIRFVVAPDGTLTPDLAETLPGRGLWVSASREAVATACEKRLFSRAARAAVTLPEGLVDRLEAQLAERCVSLLGLANRAGQLAAGKGPAHEWLRAGKSAILLTAADSDGRDAKDLQRLAKDDVRRIDVLLSEEQGRAIGRERIVHMAVSPGRLARALHREARRLAGFRVAAEARPEEDRDEFGREDAPTPTD